MRAKQPPDRRPHLYRKTHRRHLNEPCAVTRGSPRLIPLSTSSDPPDIELTPNSIMTRITEHYVSQSVTNEREHKSGSHVPNNFLGKKGPAHPPPARSGRSAVARRAAAPAEDPAPAPGRSAAARRRRAQVASSSHLSPPRLALVGKISAKCQEITHFLE